MDVALARFVGAGLALVYEGFGERVPPGAVSGGYHFVNLLAREKPAALGSMMERVVSTIWHEWRFAKLPANIAEQHLDFLPELLDTCRPPDGALLGAIAAANPTDKANKPTDHSAAKIAGAIVADAKRKGLFAAHDLNESISFFFIDRLFSQLFTEPSIFNAFRPFYRQYLAEGAWQDGEAAPVEASIDDADAVEIVDEGPSGEPADILGMLATEMSQIATSQPDAAGTTATSDSAAVVPLGAPEPHAHDERAPTGEANVEAAPTLAEDVADLEWNALDHALADAAPEGEGEAWSDIEVETGTPWPQVTAADDGETATDAATWQAAALEQGDIDAAAGSAPTPFGHDEAHGEAHGDDLAQDETYDLAGEYAIADEETRQAPADHRGTPRQDPAHEARIVIPDTPQRPYEDHDTLLARLTVEAGVPERALFQIARMAKSSVGGDSPKRLEELALGLADLLGRLSSPVGSDGDVVPLKAEAASKIASGALVDADEVLAAIEDMHLRSAHSNPALASARLASAAEARALRAEIEELSSDWRRAARHYAAAARCMPASHRMERWGLLMSQGRVLERIASLEDQADRLVEAAQLYTEAARLLSEQEAPHDWAVTNLTLGNLLLLLGEREGRQERYLAAALHFKPALDVFSELNLQEEWALTQLGLAHSLRCQGQVQGDVETLSEAAFAYRASLGIASRERMPVEWLSANVWLAETLLRLGQETGDVGFIEDAIATLRTTLMQSNGLDQPFSPQSVAMRLGRALLALGAERSDSEPIGEAIAALRAALEQPENLSQTELATANDSLGSALMCFTDDGDADDLLREAAQAKRAAFEYYRGLGDKATAHNVRQELAEIEAALSPESAGRPVTRGNPGGKVGAAA